MTHTGRAVVFESVQDLSERIDDPALDVTADDVLVLRNAGPRGAPGMPEAGYLPIPINHRRLGYEQVPRTSPASCERWLRRAARTAAPFGSN